jgi:signal transduction histidine kinase
VPLRWRVSLFVVGALCAALLIQLLFGFVLFNRALSRDLRADLVRFSLLLEEDLRESPQGGYALTPEGRLVLQQFVGYAQGRARIRTLEGETALNLAGPFPGDTDAWVRLRSPLDETYTLEVALSRARHSAELHDYLEISFFGLPILVFLLGGAGFWLSQRLLEPLKQLQETVTAVSNSSDLKTRVPVGEANDELSNLARAYNSMMARLEGFFERERTFTRYASHELRNPVASLRVQVEAAIAGDLPAEAVLPKLRLELQRLSAMLGSLLVLARDEAPSAATLDLTAVILGSVDRARAQAGEAPLFVDYRGPATCPFSGDAALLGRLFDNLLENAVKYAPEGEVLITLEARPEAVCIRVQDEGAGVSPESLPKLGTPFYRTTRTAVGGSGLGLSVVQHIVSAYHGTLHFENLTPRGFAVTVKLLKRTP